MDDHKPITSDSALAKSLDSYKVPDLPYGFADRVIAKTQDRAELLPELRNASGIKRWRTTRRLAFGTLAAGALATAAAATGALDNLPITLPSAEKVWATITGQDEPPEPAAPAAGTSGPAFIPQVSEPVVIEGPIDTPEELEEAFRRIDQVRSNRQEARRNRIDRRIDSVIERRREQGLPAPTPEQESRLREGIDQFRARRDSRVGERLEGRREEMRQSVDSGEELSREDFIRQQREVIERPGMRDRRERLRQLPPDERRERLRQFRERRMQRLEQLQAEGTTGNDAQPEKAAPEQAETPEIPTEPEGGE
ncbi:MAG: hypothetical protein AAF941_07360 [Pseudomonadota bacterium]